MTGGRILPIPADANRPQTTAPRRSFRESDDPWYFVIARLRQPKTSDGSSQALIIFHFYAVRFSSLHRIIDAPSFFRMFAPVVDQKLIVDIESNTVVRCDRKFERPGFCCADASCPPDGETIGADPGGRAFLSPVKIYRRIDPAHAGSPRSSSLLKYSPSKPFFPGSFGGESKSAPIGVISPGSSAPTA